MFAIEIRDIHKKYKGAITPALDGFSFFVLPKKIVGLLGPNGAGKTTTINILCGLVKPDSGTAIISGMDCMKEMDSIRRFIGLVPQQIALFESLTANENLLYIGRLYGLESNMLANRIRYLLERFGLDKHADKRIKAYSGGMKRRANIIASLLHEPDLLVLDEPTAGVDVQSRAMILEFMKEYKNQGKTILYTSHLMDEAEQVCDDVVIVDEGKFVINGAPKDLIKSTTNCKRLEDVFLHYTGRVVRDTPTDE